MTVLTGVGSHFCAAHVDEHGGLHGHTWEVTAWFEHGRDALVLQKELDAYLCEQFDHRRLDCWQGRGEWMARDIGEGLGCAQVDISRPLERIFARWTQPTPKTPEQPA